MTEEYQDLVERLRATERCLAAAALSRARTSLDLVELVDEIAWRLAATLDAHRPHRGREMACRAGCSWCCHVQVLVAAPEAIRIAEYLRSRLSPRELAAVVDRVARLDERTRGLDPDARVGLRLPCALLVDGRCSIYSVRPILCRGWNSLDAAACERNWAEPDSVPVPVHEPHRQLAIQTALGLDDAIWDVSLGEAGVDLDLTTALRLALEVPDAAPRWLAGEPLFAPAVARY